MCICDVWLMYMGVMIVLEGYRGGEVVWDVGGKMPYAPAFGFHSTIF